MTYSGFTAPCKKMPCVIYCSTAVTVLVLKAWINAELMVGNTAAKLPKLFQMNYTLLTLYTWFKVFTVDVIFSPKTCSALCLFKPEMDRWPQTVTDYQEQQNVLILHE